MEGSTSNTNWGIVIFLIVLFAVFMNRGGLFGGWGGPGGYGYGPDGFVGNGYGFQNYKSICDSEKTEIINTARTQYLTEQQSALTRETVTATANTTQAKIDFYAYQAERDKNAELSRQVMELKNQLFVKEQLAPVNASLVDIKCQMLRKPDVTGIGAVCPNSAIINGLGISSLNNCGCNGNVLV